MSILSILGFGAAKFVLVTMSEYSLQQRRASRTTPRISQAAWSQTRSTRPLRPQPGHRGQRPRRPGVGPRPTRVGSLPPSRTHARQPPPGLYTPRPCAIEINPRIRSATAQGQHSTERVSTASTHRPCRRARRQMGRDAESCAVPHWDPGSSPSRAAACLRVVQDQCASPRRGPWRPRRTARTCKGRVYPQVPVPAGTWGRLTKGCFRKFRNAAF